MKTHIFGGRLAALVAAVAVICAGSLVAMPRAEALGVLEIGTIGDEKVEWKLYSDGTLVFPDGATITNPGNTNAQVTQAPFKDLDVKRISGSKIILKGDAGYMFYNLSSLTDINALGTWDVSDVKSLAGIFRDCSSLENIDALAKWDTSNVTNLEDGFVGCLSLEDIGALAKWNTSKVENMIHLFRDCWSLSDIGPLAYWNTSNVWYMAGMFTGCVSLKDISPLANWNVSNVLYMEAMFADCVLLSDITPLAQWKPSKITDVLSMFDGCPLTKVDFSGWDKTKIVDIGVDDDVHWFNPNRNEYYVTSAMLDLINKGSGDGQWLLMDAIAFDGNGATGGSTSALAGLSLFTDVVLPANGFTRTAHKFTGWNTKADGTGIAYADKSEFYVRSTGILYAQWEAEFASVYRLFNRATGEHLYSSDKGEYDALVARGWIGEGVAWYAPFSSSTPVYRLFNPSSGDHHYTASEVEISVLTSQRGWVLEGDSSNTPVALFYSDDAMRAELMRLHKPGLAVGGHLHTSDPKEYEILQTRGWVGEGVSFYAAVLP